MPEVWEYPDAELVRVIDGDTLVARVTSTHVLEHGFHDTITTQASSVQRFRLNRLGAAPVKTLSGLGCSMRLAELLQPAPFHLDSVGPYKFGDEWMCELWLPDGRNVANILVAEGWAVHWNGRGVQPLPAWPRVESAYVPLPHPTRA